MGLFSQLPAGCYSDQFGAMCAGCSKAIGGGDLWVEALDKNWHPNCFVCEVSKQRGVCAYVEQLEYLKVGTIGRDWKWGQLCEINVGTAV